MTPRPVEDMTIPPIRSLVNTIAILNSMAGACWYGALSYIIYTLHHSHT